MDEISRLVGVRISPPKVWAYELAAELSVSPSQLSNFENHGLPMPHGIGIVSYETALRELKRRKGAEAAA